MPDRSMRILLLGLGNDILSDDGVGLHVVRALRDELADLANLDVLETTEMGLALLDFFVGYHAVVLVDSIQTGKAPPGFVHEVDAGAWKGLTGRTPHFLGVAETLAFGRWLGLEMPQSVRVFGIEVTDPFTLGTRMTAALEEALPTILPRIARAVRETATATGGLPVVLPVIHSNS